MGVQCYLVFGPRPVCHVWLQAEFIWRTGFREEKLVDVPHGMSDVSQEETTDDQSERRPLHCLFCKKKINIIIIES